MLWLLRVSLLMSCQLLPAIFPYLVASEVRCPTDNLLQNYCVKYSLLININIYYLPILHLSREHYFTHQSFSVSGSVY